MKGLAPLFLGIFGTFAFSWVGLTVLPNWQIGHLNPQSDEEGTDTYPQPQSGMFDRGAQVYAANGCIYCHSQQVRADYAAADIERKWGNRRSAPRDYIFERPVQLGKMRMGQDLANKSSSSWWCISCSVARGGDAGRASSRSGSIAFTSRLSGKTNRRRSAIISSRFAVTCGSSIALSQCSAIKATCSARRCCFAFPRSNGDNRRIIGCATWDTDCFVIRIADRRSAVARTNDWAAADVFRGVASCASLFAA